MSQDISQDGRPDQLPAPKRAVRNDWTVHPIVEPKTADWDVPLNEGMLERLLLGFVPTAMEEKWFVYADGQGLDSADGELTLHFVRSWGCNEVARVKTVRERGDDVTDGMPAARFTGITWDQKTWKNGNVNGRQTKEMVRDLCRLVMFVELPGGEEDEYDMEEEGRMKRRWWMMLMFWRS